MMDGLVLHKLPGEEGKGERGALPIDRCVNVDSFQCGEQLTLLVIERGEEPLASQWAEIMLVLSRPIHFPCRQRGIVDTAHTDKMPQLLAKRREPMANPMWRRCAAELPGRVGRKVPFVLGNRAHKIGGQAMEHFAVSGKVIESYNEGPHRPNVRAHLRRRMPFARAPSLGAAPCSAACLVFGRTALVV